MLPVFPGSAPYPGTDKHINKPKCWHHKGQREKVGQRQKKSKPHQKNESKEHKTRKEKFREQRISGISGVGDGSGDEWGRGYAGVLHRWATGTCRRVGPRGSPGELGKAENKGQLYTRKIAAWAARGGE